MRQTLPRSRPPGLSRNESCPTLLLSPALLRNRAAGPGSRDFAVGIDMLPAGQGFDLVLGAEFNHAVRSQHLPVGIREFLLGGGEFGFQTGCDNHTNNDVVVVLLHDLELPAPLLVI